jgi:glycosyltransferase involved in cell wall biosynthesis
MRRRHNVLLIAEAANPEWTSVPLIGWSLSRALAEITNAHILTHVRNRDAFERAGLVEGHDFTSIDNEVFASPLFKFSRRLSGGAGTGWTTITAFSSLAYYTFEQEIWRRFGERICSHEFDLVHRITPLSPTNQSPIAKRLAKHNVPFVIGPLNGGVPWPKAFVNRQHAEREWLSHVRWLYKLMPYYRSTRRYSAAIIAGSKYTYGEFPHWAKEKCVYIPENGVDLERFKNPRTHSACLPLKGAFVGRLVPYKGADMLLAAAAKFLKEGQLELHIIGDGPQRALLETMVEQLKISGSVRFHGWVPHLKVQETLRTCDFLALPSIREFGGGVVVESMALGVAPIVADYAGPSELVDDNIGIRVGFHDEQSLIEGMGDAFSLVIHSPHILDTLGAAGREKVLEKLTWEAKSRQIIAVYDAVLSGVKNLNSLGYHSQQKS